MTSVLLSDLAASQASPAWTFDAARPPEHVATLWKGAGFARRIFADGSSSYIVKVINCRAALSSVHVDSYKVEQCFYDQGLSEVCVAAGATVPMCYLCGEVPIAEGAVAAVAKRKKKKMKKKNTRKAKTKTMRGNSEVVMEDVCPALGSNPRFYSVMTDLSVFYPTIAEDLVPTQAAAALSWMAKFHGHFTGTLGKLSTSPDRALQSRELRGLWWCGTHWTLERTRHMLAAMERTFDKEYRARLVKEHQGLCSSPGVAALGKRLHAAAEALHARLQQLHPKNKSHWYTLLHGDLKGANIALGCPSESEVEAAVFDFQWTGAGLGAQDVAYFFISAADPTSLAREEELLRQYYQERKSRARGGHGSPMSWKEFVEIYEIAFLDMMRWLCAYGLWGGPAERWALEKADALLARIDDGKPASPGVYASAWA